MSNDAQRKKEQARWVVIYFQTPLRFGYGRYWVRKNKVREDGLLIFHITPSPPSYIITISPHYITTPSYITPSLYIPIITISSYHYCIPNGVRFLFLRRPSRTYLLARRCPPAAGRAAPLRLFGVGWVGALWVQDVAGYLFHFQRFELVLPGYHPFSGTPYLMVLKRSPHLRRVSSRGRSYRYCDPAFSCMPWQVKQVPLPSRLFCRRTSVCASVSSSALVSSTWLDWVPGRGLYSLSARSISIFVLLGRTPGRP